MITATADTNIYVSALQLCGAPRHFLNLAAGGAFRLAISDALIDEMCGVLSLKFAWGAVMLEEAVARLARFTIRTFPTQALRVVKEDPDDDRVLECACSAESQFIVTGDNHLLSTGYLQAN